jgi:RND family efflux transporter MFP subunit
MSPAQPSEPASDLARDLAVLRGGGAPEPSRRRPRRRWGLGLIVLALLIAGAAGYVASRSWLQPPEVSLVAVSRRQVGLPAVELSASGYLVARRQITVSSKAQGKIVEMPVEENQQLRAGDLVARLENDEQRASLALADAEFEQSTLELERARRLRAQGTVAQSALDAAETAWRVARARRDLAQVALDNTVLRAPIDGTVIRKLRDEGEFLTIGVTAEGDPGTAVVTLADLSALDVELEISETEIRKVRLGQPVLVTPEALPDRSYLADVTEIAAMADRQKGVVPVKVRIRRPGPELLPDMTATVRFLASEPQGPIETLPALPASAVVTRGGESVVYVAGDETVESVPVRTRAIDDETVALLEGPGLDTYVVDQPPADLRSGDAIRVHTP